MAWSTQNRRQQKIERREQAYLTEQMKSLLTEKYFPRYPSRRAVTLPALHLIQHEHGWIPMQAIEELAGFLQLTPAEVLDTASFYEEFWLKPKGKYLIAVCRSLACELCGSNDLTARLQEKLGIEPGQTTPDGRFTLVELECLGSCGTAPAALINDVLHEQLTGDDLDRVLDSLPDDPKECKDPAVTWPLG